MSTFPADADRSPTGSGGFPYGLVAAMIAAIELIVMVICLGFMYVALDSSGGWFTAVTYQARKTVWTNASIVPLAVIAAASVYGVIYLLRRRRAGMLLVQLVFLAAQLAITALAHGRIPMPPGIQPGAV